MENVNHFKAAISAALAVLTALWGWFGWLTIGWITAMVMDIITGMAAGAKAGEWSSAKARQGLWHKAGCIAAVAVAGLMDLVVGQVISQIPEITLPFNYTVLLCPLVMVWYFITEVGSIAENAGKLGAPIPDFLKKAIAALSDKMDAKVGNEVESHDDQ